MNPIQPQGGGHGRLARQNTPAAVYGRLRVVILGVVGKVGMAPSPCHGRRAVPVTTVARRLSCRNDAPMRTLVCQGTELAFEPAVHVIKACRLLPRKPFAYSAP